MENEQAVAPRIDAADAKRIVASFTEARRQNAPQPITIAAAIGKAQFLRTQPELILSDRDAKATIGALLAALELNRCFFKALVRGQEVFVLVQQDRAAPHAIAEWAAFAMKHDCEPAKVDDALRTVKRWMDQPDNATKWPT